MPSCRVFLIAAAAFVLAVLAAAPASAQHAYWLRGGVTTVHSGNLNGLEIEIGMNQVAFLSSFTGRRTINGEPQTTVLGVPSGMSITICGGDDAVGSSSSRGIYHPSERAYIRLCTTGDFFEDWQMRIRVRRTPNLTSWISGNDEYTFGPITVRAQNTQSTLALSDNSISENGGVATVTATLSQPQGAPVTITVATTPLADTGMSASDYTLSSPSTLTFAAGSTTSTGTVTITAVDNAATAAAKTMRISGTITGGDGIGVRPPASLFLRITDDETSASATPTLALSSSSIAEAGGVTTVTATLDQTISDQVRVWVYTAPGAGAPPGGFNQSTTNPLTIAAGATASTGTVTITAVDDDVYTSGRTVRVFGQARGGNTANPADVTLTITDDETLPTATLALSSSSIAEAGGETTVTATLSAKVGEALVLTVSAAPGSGTDFTVSSANTLTIAAGATTSTGTVTITGNDDNVDEPNESVTVSATATGGNGVMDPPTQTLTITDDDAAPDLTLALSDNSITENGGLSTVSATLSHPSSAVSTVTVTAVSGVFTVPSGAAGRIVIAAGDTTSTDTVTITAANNDVHSGNRAAMVTATFANDQGTGSVTGVSLTLEEDEMLPVATLALSSSSIAEASGVATVTATLSGKSSQVVTITVSATAGTGAVAGDFNLSPATTLTIAAGATTSTGTVTVTAVDNTAQSGSKQVTVSATAAGGNSVVNPADATLTITDDDVATPTLALSSSSIAENGGMATVTATLDRQSSVAVTVTVSATAVSPAVAGDLTLSSAPLLIFAANATTSTGTVTITAVNNTTDAPDKAVTVSGTSSDSLSLANNPASVPLTITDDDAAPDLTLALSDNSITENGGLSTVSATLSHPSSAVSTVTVTAVSGVFTVPSGAAGRIVIAAGDTTSTDTVTITAANNDVHSGNRAAMVTATFANDQGTGSVTGVSLTLEEDEMLPVATLALSSSSIAEASGVATVTATLSGKSSQVVTITVSATAGTGAVAGDFNLSPATTLTIAAGATTSTGTVTVTAVDNTAQSGSKQVTVSATAAGGNSVVNPADATLTITDDDVATPTLALSSSSIAENGGMATVTATLDRQSSVAVTVTVSATAVSPAVAGDLTLSSAPLLIFAANATTSTGTVTITAVNNTTDAPDKAVTVSGTSSDSLSLANNPASVPLTITDDDAAPDLTLALSDNSITENGGLSTVSATLSHPSSAVSTVTVTAVSGVFTVPSGAAGRIVIAAGDTTSTDTVTITAANNDVHSGNRAAMVTATFANDQGTGSVTGVSLTLEEDEMLPVATLALSSSSIAEASGVATVTATLSGKSSQVVTITVSATAGTGAVAGDFNLSPATTLTIAAGATTSTGTVTVTAVDNTAQSGSKQVTVSATAAGGNSVVNPADATLTITDDDVATPTLALSSSSIAENGGMATVTATLDRQSSVAVTVTVSATAVSPAVAGDLTLSSAPLLIFAANATTSTGTVTITAVNNTTDAPDKAVTVSGTSSDSLSLANNPASVPLTITDDDDPPDVTLSLSVASIAENGGTSVVSAVLSRPSSAITTVTVTPVSGSFTVPSTPADRRIVIAAGDTTSTDTVTVTAVDDDVDSPDRTAPVTATMANAQGTGSVTGVTLTLTDNDDAPTVTLSASPASISENEATSAISAALSNPSSAVTTVTVTAAMGAAYTVASGAGATIVVAAGATTSTDTATVTAVDNDVDAADNAVTVTGTAANGHGVGAVTGASLTITDDDTAGLAVVPSTSTSSRLRTTEAGGTATFTVALATQPTGNVSVSVSSSDAAQGTASTSSLTFTPSDWNTAQTVTLTGVDDDHPVNNPGGSTDGSQTYTVTLTSGSSTDAPYNGLAQVTVYAINADDELGLSVGAVTGQATEAGGTATFTVALLTQPTAAVAVAVSSGDPSEGRVSPPSLTFSTSNWNTNQTVTVTGVNDAVDDDTVAWAVQLDPSSPGSSGDSDYHALANVDVAVTTTDDDTAELVVAPTPSSTARLQTTEAGGTETFTVRLATEPTGDVVLDVASTNTAEGTVLPSALTFTGGTTGTWNTVQTVTLTGVNDAVDDGDQNYEATLTVNQTSTMDTVYDALSVVTVYATNADDDAAGLAVSPSTSTTSRLRTREDGSQATFTVALTTQPTGAVVLDVASTDMAQGTVSPAALTFAAADWNTAQTVTLTGVDDNPGLPDGSQDYEVTLTVNQGSTADSTYDGLTAVTVYAINADDELGLEVGPVSGQVTEEGGTATFTVALITAPTGPVQVAVSSRDPTEGTVAPATLTFTPTTWNTAQAVTVTGVDDDVDDGNVAWKVRLDPSSPGPGGDADYHALASEDVDVTTEDNDGLPTVRLALSSTAVTEAGGVATVTATLSGKSSEAVTVTVATTAVAPAGPEDFALSAETTLTIAAGTTTSTGLVTVTARDNDVDAPDKQITVSATATGGHGVENPPDVTLTLTDDDTAALLLAPTALALEEQTADPQDTATYTVRLATEPTGAVTVTVTKAAVANSNAEVVTVAPPTLTFTMADWATAQPVRVTTVAEAANDYRDDMVDLTHTGSSTDGQYDSRSNESLADAVRVTVTDIDPLPEIKAGADTTFNGHAVRVTATQGDATGAAVVVTPPADLNGALTVAIEPATTEDAVTASDATADPGAGRRFSLGTGAARTVVDIEVTGTGLATVQADGLRICLPVRTALRDEAGNRPLRLLYSPDGIEWTVLDPENVEDEGERLCVTQRTFSLFAVAYQDAQPRFAAADKKLAPKTYLTGREVNDELPGATGGDGGRTYTLTPALPAGLEHTQPTAGARHGGTITGTPTTPTAKQDYTLTVRDEDGDTDSITFSIEVKPGIESRDLSLVLAGIGRTLATDAVEILGGRFGSSPASRPQITLGGQVLRLTEGGKSGEGGVESGEGRPQGGAAPAAGLSPSSPPPSDSPSPLAGEGRG